MNKGTGRKNRMDPTLRADYVSIDERSLLDRIQLTLDYAEEIKFYSWDKEVITEGWQSFFRRDSAFIIAEIANSDLEKFKVQVPPFDVMNTEMLDFLELRMRYLLESNYRGSLVQEMEMLIKSIKNDLASGGTHETDTFLYKKIFGHLVFIKEKATKKFEKEILGSSNHFPQVGLLLTFFELFGFVQRDMNSLTKKHLDYYYGELLQLKRKFLERQSAIVALQPQQGVEDVLIEKGDRFTFILDGGVEKIFEADSPTPINNAIITDIRTLYRSDYSLYGNTDVGDEFKFHLLYDTQLLGNGKNYFQSTQEGPSELPAVCGEAILSKSDAPRKVNLSQLGIMVSSPSLLLAKGRQRISLDFNLTHTSYKEAIAVFQDWNQQEGSPGRKGGKYAYQLKLSDIIRDAFQLFITDELGWKKIDRIKAKLTEVDKKPALNISFALLEGVESLVPLNNDIHEGDFSSRWPCIKILLNNYAIIHPYRFLEKLVIKDIVINAHVSGATDLMLSNSIGELDSSVPFTPFGPAPRPGSYLRIEHPLILQRNLTELELTLEWNGLPQGINGMQNHYREYPGDIRTESFRAALSQTRNLDDSKPNQLEETFPLFTTNRNSGMLASTNKISPKLENLFFGNSMPTIKESSTKPYAPLYIILTHPDMAFGHHIYANIYAQTALQKGWFAKKRLPLPNLPYTPILEQIQVNYTNTSKEIMLRKRDDDGSDIKLVHLYPFGHEQVFPATIKSPRFLLPQIGFKGCLYLGIKQVRMQDTISIGFDLEPAIYPHTLVKKPDIRWEYLVNNEWLPFKELLLEDSTEGLIKSGIIKLKMPENIQLDNTLLPKDHFWIRAGTHDVEDLSSKIKNLFTQAVSVTSSRRNKDIEAAENREGSVTKINVDTHSKILKITGPYHFRLAEIIEDEESYYSRISERLRHKNRAVAPWDFERLILDKFKQIQKLRVYGRSRYPGELVKGSSVQIVVIPRDHKSGNGYEKREALDFSTLLEIKKYIQRFVSPHVHVEVSNPVYELLKVRCYVQVHDYAQSGHMYHQLNQELIQFLSPNIDIDSFDKGFEESISKTEILNFIESRPYVKSVLNLSVFQLLDVEESYKIIDTELIGHIDRLRTISPYAILTSAPLHHITIVPEDLSLPEIAYIDDVAIGSDFIISDNEGYYN